MSGGYLAVGLGGVDCQPAEGRVLGHMRCVGAQGGTILRGYSHRQWTHLLRTQPDIGRTIINIR